MTGPGRGEDPRARFETVITVLGLVAVAVIAFAR
jgi:hypothetical protein